VDIGEEQQGYQSADSSDECGFEAISLRSNKAYYDYKSLFRDLPHGIVETNRDGKIVFKIGRAHV